MLSRGNSWNTINWFKSAIFLFLSQANTWISNVICCSSLFLMLNELRYVIVSFVDIGGIVDHHCPFIEQVTDKLYHIMVYTLPWSRFERTISVGIGTNCIGICQSNYHTITTKTRLWSITRTVLTALYPTPWQSSAFRAPTCNYPSCPLVKTALSMC
jgi:hypothetical protein